MHTWSEHTRIYTTHGTILSYRDRCGVGGLAAGPEIALGAADAEPILCAEVARLAQRVQDLEAEREELREAIAKMEALGAAWKRTAEACSDAASKHLARIAALEFDLTAARSANDLLGGKINRLEADLAGEIMAHQGSKMAAEETILGLKERAARIQERSGALQSEVNHLEAETIHLQRTLTERENAARETITGQRQSNGALQKRLHEVQDALSAERSRGQQYCLELAEKAEAIRRLRGEVAELREDNRVYGEQKLNWTADNQRQRGLVKMLEAAIEDGIAHVERARSLILTVAPYTLADFEQEALQHLDLAHEALSKAAAPRVETASAVPTGPGPEACAPRSLVLEGIARIEGRLHRIANAIAREKE